MRRKSISDLLLLTTDEWCENKNKVEIWRHSKTAIWISSSKEVSTKLLRSTITSMTLILNIETLNHAVRSKYSVEYGVSYFQDGGAVFDDDKTGRKAIATVYADKIMHYLLRSSRIHPFPTPGSLPEI
jgi:hypothetical protein